jgi:flagellar export protein FliJ
MPQFTFALQPLLKHRERAEQERQRDMALVSAELVAAQGDLRQVERTVVAALTDLRENRLTGPIDLSFLTAHRRFMTAMRRQGVERAERVRLAAGRVAVAQRALAEAAKERKAIETLRDQQLEQWRAERARRQTADDDEIATQMATADLAADEASAARGNGAV